MTVSVLLVTLLAHSHISAVPRVGAYEGRNGRAEALADIARRKPAKVYIRTICGEFCRISAVGIRNCEPERFDTQTAPKTFFVDIPELFFGENYDEQVTRTDEQRRQANSAYTFAKAYNLTIFRTTKTAILRHCPRAELE